MRFYTFDVVVFDGPSSCSGRKETVFKTTFKAESLFSAVSGLIGIFSGCNWFAVRCYVDTPSSSWLEYVTVYDSDIGFTDYIDCDEVA